eukprot:s3024_g5.t1
MPWRRCASGMKAVPSSMSRSLWTKCSGGYWNRQKRLAHGFLPTLYGLRPSWYRFASPFSTPPKVRWRSQGAAHRAQRTSAEPLRRCWCTADRPPRCYPGR